MPEKMTATESNTIPGTEVLGRPVSLSKIEKELQILFMGDGDSEGEGNGGVARASLTNLAIYNEDRSAIIADHEDLEEVTRESACRAILINADTKTKEVSASAWIQAHCKIGGEGGKTVCTEQISFCLSGDSADLVRNIVFANLDSDLPLIFWWRGEFSHTFEDRLYSRIDRLIFDSETWDQPRNQFLRLAEAQKNESSRLSAHDLAFTRLNPVRHAIAGTFDNPRICDQISSMENVHIRFGKGHSMSAIYLCAWIASRLDLRLDQKKSAPGQFCFKGNRDNAPGVLSVLVEPLDVDRKGIVEIDFEVGDQKIEISRCRKSEFLRTRISTNSDGENGNEDWLPAGGDSDPSLVIEILKRAGRNRSFADILPLVGELLTV